MSRVLWLDCAAGAAGDMLLGALLDAGADEATVRAGLDALGLPRWRLQVDEVHRGAFRARHVRFLLDDHDHGAGHGHDHPHRPWSEVRALLAAAPLPERARTRALSVYQRLAEAEAALHGMPVDEVELHEVGALDAILDVTGVCLALEDLDVDRIVASPLPLGAGHTHGAHGRLPLPAPATLALLEGWPVVPGPGPGEWITPTGAALIATLAEPGPPPPMTLGRTGYGAGTRDPAAIPNLVRAVLGTPAYAEAPEAVVDLACNLDDLPGEQVPAVIEALLAAGALDAWVLPVHMKKVRPGLLLGALARPADADTLSDLLLRHTSTLGVRRTPAFRRVLDRWTEPVQTPYGEVRVKVGGRDGAPWHAAPEHADVAARAREAGIPEHEVHAAALVAWRTKHHRSPGC